MTPLMLGLFLGWALSPLGSQAAFRAISRQSRVIDTPMSIDLLDTNSPWPRSLTLWDTDQWDTVKLVYSASIAANSATRNASVDPWSNILVPAIETFENTSIPDAEGWFRDLNLNMAQRASLLGIPFTGKGLERADFTFQTSYFQLTTVNLTFIRNKTWDLSPQYTANATKKTAGYSNSTGQRGDVVLATWWEPNWWDTSFDEHWQPGVPQRLIYQDKSLGFIRAEFDVTMNYVEIQVSRNSSSASRPWQLIAIRRVRNTTGIDTAWSPLKYSMIYTFFTSGFLSVYPFRRSWSPTNLQRYLADPTGASDSPGDISEDKVKNITPEDLAIRMGQLLNTHWLASLAPTSILRNFDASGDSDFNVQASSNGTSYADEEFLQCHAPWLQILFTCSFFLMVTAIGSGVFECLSNAPDVLDTISSLTRENQIVVGEGGSYLDGDDRTRILKNLVVRMGDAAPDAEIGLVVLANVGKLGKLDRNKQYA